jgi:hypothetical protein
LEVTTPTTATIAPPPPPATTTLAAKETQELKAEKNLPLSTLSDKKSFF